MIGAYHNWYSFYAGISTKTCYKAIIINILPKQTACSLPQESIQEKQIEAHLLDAVFEILYKQSSNVGHGVEFAQHSLFEATQVPFGHFPFFVVLLKFLKALGDRIQLGPQARALFTGFLVLQRQSAHLTEEGKQKSSVTLVRTPFKQI